MKCEVCGRTEEELQEEFGLESAISEHQGIDKCEKCRREYEIETQADSTEEEVDTKDWREALTA